MAIRERVFAIDFLYREYSIHGRWPSPDPASLDAADPSIPQSRNRYAYVHNGPLNLIDPLGLCGETPWGPYDYSNCRVTSTGSVSVSLVVGTRVVRNENGAGL